jgi:hypothetical protein
MPFGSWAVLVKRGGLGVWPHVLAHRRGGKTASFLWGNFSISHSEVLMLPTSPHVILLAKSFSWRISRPTTRLYKDIPALHRTYTNSL